MKTELSGARRVSMAAALSVLLAACSGGGKGGGTPPPPPPPPTDTTPPDTTLSGTPASPTNSTTADFTFTSTEAGSTFEARLDGAAYAAVTSPRSLTSLTDGTHTFEVRAKDAAGNADTTPASATWVVDTIPPDTTLTSVLATTVYTAQVSVTATSTDTTATFEVSVDGAAYVGAAMPYFVTINANGPHSISVRARDTAGNVDATPATAQWTTDLDTPETTLTSMPTAITNSQAATFGFTSNKSPVQFEYSLDGSAYAAAIAPLMLTLNSPAEGLHTFSVRAKNGGGVLDPTPATFTWRIDQTPPTGAMLFPTPVSYTDSNTLTVRGIANDAYGLQSVRVNGVLASTATSFNTWSAAIPIAEGNNPVTVSVTDAAGNVTASAASALVANGGPMLLQAGGADYDALRDRLVVTDIESHKLVSYHAMTGIGQLLADFSKASANSALADVAVDAANDRALVVDWGQDALIAVNLMNGDLQSVLSQGTGTGPTTLAPSFGLAHDPAGNRAFVTVGGSVNAVLSINLATGVRTIVSGPGVGTGTAFSNPTGIAYDATASRLLVADAPSTGAAIYSVDLATGTRVVLSQSPGTGTGPSMTAPLSIKLDVARNRLYVLDALTTNSVFSVDLATGNRSLIASPSVGTGVALNNGRGLAYQPSFSRLFVPQTAGNVVSILTDTLTRGNVVDGRVGAGFRLDHPRTVHAEQTSGAITSLLFGEPEAQRIMRLDLATSTSSTVSGSARGTGPALGRLVDFVLDTRAPANGRSAFGLLGSPGNALVSVDLNTGNRATLTALTATAQPRNLRLDAGANRVIYTNADFSGSTSGFYSIQLPGLGQSAISSSSVGSGPAFTGPSTFVLEPATSPTRALFVDLNPSAWRTLDLGSGARGSFTTINGNPALPLLGSLFLDDPNSQVYGLNIYPPHLFVTTLTPGGGEIGRDMVSGQVPGSMGIIGSGPLVTFGSGVFVDTTRNVAFVSDSTAGTIMAIDLASGDRVVISR